MFIQDLHVGEYGKIIGLVKAVRRIRTKKGEPMAFVTLNDSSGDCSLTLFPVKYRQYSRLLEKGEILYVEGKVENNRDQMKQVLVDQMEDVKVLHQTLNSDKCFIRIPADKSDAQTLQELKEVLKTYAGNIPVILFYASTNKKMVLNQTEWVDGTEKLQKALEEIIGSGNIVFQKKE